MAKYFLIVILAVSFECNGHLLDVLGGVHKQVHSTIHGAASTVLGGFNLNFGAQFNAQGHGHQQQRPINQNGPHFNQEKQPETVIVVVEETGPENNNGNGPGYNQGGHGYHNQNGGHPNQNNNGQPNQNNYGRPNQNNYGNPHQNNYGQPSQNNYGNPNQNNYGRPGQNNYGRPDQNNGPNQNNYGNSNQNNGNPNQNNYGRPNQNNGRPDQNNVNPNQNNYGNPNQNNGRPDQNNENPNQGSPDPQYKPTEPDNRPNFDIQPSVNNEEQKPSEKPTLDKTTEKDQPLFVPLNPNEYIYGGDKIEVNAPKRETDTKKPADDEDQDFPIDVRFQNE